MGVYKRLLGFSNYNRTLAAKRLNTPGGYRNQNQSERAIRLSGVDLRQFNKDIEKLLKSIRDKEAVKNIVYPASDTIKTRARQLTPIAEKRRRQKGFTRDLSPKKLRPDVLYFYEKQGSKRAAKGKGKIRYKFGLGNIRSSIQVISKEKGYKEPIGIIGPMFTKKKSVVTPNDKRFNGWYAHMIFGGAKQFGEKVTIKAFRQTQGIVYNQIRNSVDRYLNKTTKTLRKVS